MKWIYPAVLLAAIALMVAGINLARSRSQSSVVQVKEPIKELKDAVEAARAKLPDFIRRVSKPLDGDEAFALQTRIIGKNGVAEHIWVDNLTFVGDHFEGTIAQQPFSLPGVSKGDFVQVKPKDISDWMIKRADGSVEGGFAEKALKAPK